MRRRVRSGGFRLYKKFSVEKRPHDVVLVTGNRRTWRYAEGGRIRVTVNAGEGWRGLVHSLSHACHLDRGVSSHHSADHALLEVRMARHGVDSGWLDPTWCPEPAKKAPRASAPTPAPDPRGVRLKQVNEGIRRWNTKLKRAETWLAKLRREHARLERAIARAEAPRPA